VKHSISFRCGGSKEKYYLNTGTHSFFAQGTSELPTSLWNIRKSHSKSHAVGTLKSSLWNPKSTSNMYPFSIVRHLHRSFVTRTKSTTCSRVLLTFLTKPPSFRNIHDPITVLMNAHVASITEDNQICIIRVIIATNTTNNIYREIVINRFDFLIREG
jgi:hypothetical protein